MNDGYVTPVPFSEVVLLSGAGVALGVSELVVVDVSEGSMEVLDEFEATVVFDGRV